MHIGRPVTLLLMAGLLHISVADAQSSKADSQKLDTLVEDALQQPSPAEGIQALDPGQPVPTAPAPVPPVVGTKDSALESDKASEAVETNTAEPTELTLKDLRLEEVNAATYRDGAELIKGASPLILKTQILLDRAGASPGVIDAYNGDNVAKAIAAVETVLNLPVDGKLNRDVWAALVAANAPPVLVAYTISDEDLAGPFTPDISADYSEQAKLSHLGYRGPAEMFAERFHMDGDLLAALNPHADLKRVGTQIIVADVQGKPITGRIALIQIDKRQKQVRAYDSENRLVVAYPATIGSPDNPSPSGDHIVKKVTLDPFYNYNPANFLQGDNKTKLTLPPGPNNPVGTVWIALSEPSYGIHGTPQPSKVDKTGSHGCVRLTNWDAEELAGLVEPGVAVQFIE
jgi:lipoprotein-anchoring transpeptidase ErfK/SrfK